MRIFILLLNMIIISNLTIASESNNEMFPNIASEHFLISNIKTQQYYLIHINDSDGCPYLNIFDSTKCSKENMLDGNIIVKLSKNTFESLIIKTMEIYSISDTAINPDIRIQAIRKLSFTYCPTEDLLFEDYYFPTTEKRRKPPYKPYCPVEVLAFENNSQIKWMLNLLRDVVFGGKNDELIKMNIPKEVLRKFLSKD